MCHCISRFMKILFNIRESKPNIGYVWDVSLVFEYFETGLDNPDLTGIVLSQKFDDFPLVIGRTKSKYINIIFCTENDHQRPTCYLCARWCLEVL